MQHLSSISTDHLGAGFGLVPLRESRVAHAYRAPRLCRAERAYIARSTDPMALQASMILRDVLRDLRTMQEA